MEVLPPAEDDEKSSHSSAATAHFTEVYEELSVYAKDAFNSIHLRQNGDVKCSSEDKAEKDEVGGESDNDKRNEDEDVDSNRIFNATMQVANYLIAEIHDYKYRQMDNGSGGTGKDRRTSSGGMVSGVPENVLRSACYGEVCLNTMLQVVGGFNGNNLASLTINQLLDLIVWIEFFREVLREANPDIKKRGTLKRTYLDDKPDIFVVPPKNKKDAHKYDSDDDGDEEQNDDLAADADDDEYDPEDFTARLLEMLVWVHNMSWEVHRLAQDEFLLRTKRTTDQWLSQVYTKKYEVWQTKEGRLVTNLSEDVFAMVSLQMRTMQERLTDNAPDALIIGVCITFSRLREKQLMSRDSFLKDFETCCAAANDFQRMSDMVDNVCDDLTDLPKGSEELLEGCRTDLISTFTQDAVFSAQKASVYIFEPIRESIFGQLFEKRWLHMLTENELAKKITRTLQDFTEDLVSFLDDYLMRKLLIALVQATVNFYVERLVNIAELHPRGPRIKAHFTDVPQMTKRFDDDIQILVDFFDSLSTVVPGMPREYTRNLNLLNAINDLMSIAASGKPHNGAEGVDDFIVVLHKSTRDISVTRSFVGDLWLLTKPKERKKMKRYVLKQKHVLDNAFALTTVDDSKKNFDLAIMDVEHSREHVQELELGLLLKEEYARRKKERLRRRLRLRNKKNNNKFFSCRTRNPQVVPLGVQQ